MCKSNDDCSKGETCRSGVCTQTAATSSIRPWLVASFVAVCLLLLTSCLTPAKVMAGLTTLDSLSQKADAAYGQCLANPKRVEPAACVGFHLCLDVTAKAGQLGAKAIADASDKDPWMRGANSTAYKSVFPVATDVCAAAKVTQ